MIPIGMTELRPRELRELTKPRKGPRPKDDTTGKLFYELKTQGMSWAQIARIHGVKTPYWCLTNARLYAMTHGKPVIDAKKVYRRRASKSRVAYELRMEWGFEWEIIAQFLCFQSGHTALTAAKHYAVRHHLELPVHLELSARL